MMEHEELLQGLNSEQQSAVCASCRSSILVLAGAGCGKTTVLTRRIAWLCGKGFKPERICALTFTRKATEEMRERIIKMSDTGTNFSMPRVTTFHSFSLSILRDKIAMEDNFSRLGYRVHPQLQSDVDRIKMVYESTSKGECNIFKVDVHGLDNLLTKLTVFPERIEQFDEEKKQLIIDIKKRIASRKKELGFWGFDDLTPAVIELFTKNPALQKTYRDTFDYFLVDEFQDTNPVQINFLKMILPDTPGLFAVGDDDQAIYGFRGADIRPTLEFCTHFPDASLFKLQVNYRSVPPILKTANKIFRHKPPEYRKILSSGIYHSGEGKRPTIINFDNDEQMIDWVIREANRCATRYEISINQCVMLFRINRSKERVCTYFMDRAIPESGIPQLLTIHGSKGLEFPVVFLCDLEESVFPNYRLSHTSSVKDSFWRSILKLLFPVKPEIVCDWDEEQRLFYVGVTRAQKALYLISTEQKLLYGKKRKFKKSRLLKLVK